MKKYLIFFFVFLIPVLLHAGSVTLDGVKYDYDDGLSGKSYSGWNFRVIRSSADFSGKTIYKTSFTNEIPDVEIFPEGTENMTFVWCHLENVKLPPGSKVIAPDCDGSPCWTERFKEQNDRRDWKIDKAGKPLKVLNEEVWKDKNISVEVKDIPIEKIELDESKNLEENLKVKLTPISEPIKEEILEP